MSRKRDFFFKNVILPKIWFRKKIDCDNIIIQIQFTNSTLGKKFSLSLIALTSFTQNYFVPSLPITHMKRFWTRETQNGHNKDEKQNCNYI